MALKYILTIRDPFHGNIRFTELERRIIDSPIFQRLRGLKQSSLAHYTYPTALTTRFEHSLGTSFVASKIFLHLEDKCPDPFREVIRSVARLYKRRASTATTDATHQGVRIAALLHDVGHLPFSHCFEDDLHLLLLDESRAKAFWGVRADEYARYVQPGAKRAGKRGAPAPPQYRPKLHEFIGYRLAAQHPDIKAAVRTPSDRLAYRIALDLLNAARSEAASNVIISEVLGSIIHGDCDADRMDFVRRDSGMAGSSLGSFDIDRLIDSLVLYDDGHKLRLLPDIRGISALESFFTARLAIYRWQYHHHNVIYHDLVLKLLVRMALNGKFKKHTRCNFLAELSFANLMRSGTPGIVKAPWIPRDDGLVLQALMDVHASLRKKRWRSHSIDERRTIAMLEEVLFRKKCRVALWKDHIGYSMFAVMVESELVRVIRAVSGETAKGAGERIQKWLRGERVRAMAGNPGFVCNVFVHRIRDKNRLARLQGWLWDNGLAEVVVDHRRVTPFSRQKAGAGSEVEVCGRVGDDPRVRPMTDVSDVLRGLDEARNQEVRFFAYELDLKSGSLRRPSVDSGRRRLAAKLVAWSLEDGEVIKADEKKLLGLED